MAVAGKNLNCIDVSTLMYNAVVVLILVFFRSRIPLWHSEILINLAILLLIIFIVSRIRDSSPPAARFFKGFYPLLLLLAEYEQTSRINRIVFPEILDPLFQRVEYMLFGFQPAIAFAEAFPHPWLVEYMHFSYFTYYFQFPILGLMLYCKRDRQPFIEYMFSLCNTFYVCYLIYIVLPVVGPPVFNMNDFSMGGWFTSIMADIYEKFEVGGAAFPSSHVAVAAVVLYYGVKYFPRGIPIFAVLFVSLTLSTVYCRYHYAIDVICGVLTAVALIFISQTLQRYLLKNTPQGDLFS